MHENHLLSCLFAQQDKNLPATKSSDQALTVLGPSAASWWCATCARWDWTSHNWWAIDWKNRCFPHLCQPGTYLNHIKKPSLAFQNKHFVMMDSPVLPWFVLGKNPTQTLKGNRRRQRFPSRNMAGHRRRVSSRENTCWQESSSQGSQRG